ncbi:hypothetical protein WDU94_004055 [Cyamophila willieti]
MGRTGYTRGLPLERILGASKVTGELLFLIKWKHCDELELVPAKEVNEHNTQEVIEFYEKRIVFKSKFIVVKSDDSDPHRSNQS